MNNQQNKTSKGFPYYMAHNRKQIAAASKSCPPLIIYLVLASISTLSSLFFSNRYLDENEFNDRSKFGSFIMHLITIAIWSFLLYWLCENNHMTAAWLLLLVPMLVIFFLIFMIFYLAVADKRHHDHRRR